ncbi:uncharacterized protein LOC144350911 [Saccoglossus kowalevskii]
MRGNALRIRSAHLKQTFKMAATTNKYASRSPNARKFKGFLTEKEKRRRLAVIQANRQHKKVAEVVLESNSEVTSESAINWNVGRRIVQLSVLAEGLKACAVCCEHLVLVDCQEERRYGLGSVLYIPCQRCGAVNHVYTGSTHRNAKSNQGLPIFDVNTKLATGMVHSGMGETHVNNFLASLNIPGIHHRH